MTVADFNVRYNDEKYVDQDRNCRVNSWHSGISPSLFAYVVVSVIPDHRPQPIYNAVTEKGFRQILSSAPMLDLFAPPQIGWTCFCTMDSEGGYASTLK